MADSMTERNYHSTRLNSEGFRYIEEKCLWEGPGVTAEEFARVFGIKKSSAATWLSKWTNYYNKQRDIVQHFLVHIPGRPGHYKTGPDWWAERWKGTTACEETFVDKLDMEYIVSIGKKPLDVIFADWNRKEGELDIKTRTDSCTGKHTDKGARTTGRRLGYIAMKGGITPKELADHFGITVKSAASQLSRWHKKELVRYWHGKYVVGFDKYLGE